VCGASGDPLLNARVWVLRFVVVHAEANQAREQCRGLHSFTLELNSSNSRTRL
jgi:hypothetical protein